MGARETVLHEGDATRFGVVQAITAIARRMTLDTTPLSCYPGFCRTRKGGLR